jgi:hypothetical protein
VFIGPKTPWAYLGFLGFLPLITGIIGYYPPYKWFGINTRKHTETRRMSTEGIISLIDSLEPFKQCFNGNMDKIRLVAIVSPT